MKHVAYVGNTKPNSSRLERRAGQIRRVIDRIPDSDFPVEKTQFKVYQDISSLEAALRKDEVSMIILESTVGDSRSLITPYSVAKDLFAIRPGILMLSRPTTREKRDYRFDTIVPGKSLAGLVESIHETMGPEMAQITIARSVQQLEDDQRIPVGWRGRLADAFFGEEGNRRMIPEEELILAFNGLVKKAMGYYAVELYGGGQNGNGILQDLTKLQIGHPGGWFKRGKVVGVVRGKLAISHDLARDIPEEKIQFVPGEGENPPYVLVDQEQLAFHIAPSRTVVDGDKYHQGPQTDTWIREIFSQDPVLSELIVRPIARLTSKPDSLSTTPLEIGLEECVLGPTHYDVQLRLREALDEKVEEAEIARKVFGGSRARETMRNTLRTYSSIIGSASRNAMLGLVIHNELVSRRAELLKTNDADYTALTDALASLRRNGSVRDDLRSLIISTEDVRNTVTVGVKRLSEQTYSKLLNEKQQSDFEKAMSHLFKSNDSYFRISDALYSSVSGMYVGRREVGLLDKDVHHRNAAFKDLVDSRANILFTLIKPDAHDVLWKRHGLGNLSDGRLHDWIDSNLISPDAIAHMTKGFDLELPRLMHPHFYRHQVVQDYSVGRVINVRPSINQSSDYYPKFTVGVTKNNPTYVNMAPFGIIGAVNDAIGKTIGFNEQFTESTIETYVHHAAYGALFVLGEQMTNIMNKPGAHYARNLEWATRMIPKLKIDPVVGPEIIQDLNALGTVAKLFGIAAERAAAEA